MTCVHVKVFPVDPLVETVVMEEREWITEFGNEEEDEEEEEEEEEGGQQQEEAEREEGGIAQAQQIVLEPLTVHLPPEERSRGLSVSLPPE